MNLADITPMVLTYNESVNINRTLSKLRWAKEVVVIDSGSTDATLAIVAEFPNTRVVYRPFDSFADQCNFGLNQIQTDWVLSLDADYVLEDAFEEELRRIDPSGETSGFKAAFIYCIEGRPLRASLYPPRSVLYRRTNARYRNDGHGHRVEIIGSVLELHSRISHDDRKPLSRWLSSQDLYARKEADKLAEASYTDLRFQDKLRKTMFAAIPATLIYTLIVKGTLFDGWRGWYYTLQRTIAEVMLALRLLEKQFNERTDP